MCEDRSGPPDLQGPGIGYETLCRPESRRIVCLHALPVGTLEADGADHGLGRVFDQPAARRNEISPPPRRILSPSARIRGRTRMGAMDVARRARLAWVFTVPPLRLGSRCGSVTPGERSDGMR